jgi:hypothetical protein
MAPTDSWVAGGGPGDPRHDHAGDHLSAAQHGHGDHQQQRVQQGHHRDGGQQHQGVGDGRHQGLGGDLAQQGGVGGDPGHEVAGLAAVHGRDAQPHQVGDQAASGVQDHRLGGPVQHIAAQRADPGVGQGQHGQPHQRFGHRPVLGEVVDQPLGGQWQGQADCAGGEAQ